MAAYAALVSLLNNIEQMMNHPHLSASLPKNQILPLQEKAGLLLDFIESYNYGGMISNEVEDLERRIAYAAHDAEDVIESHIVDQIHAQSSISSFVFNLQKKKIQHLKKKVQHLKRGHHEAEARLSCSLQLPQIVQVMDDILVKAAEIIREREELRLREDEPSSSTILRETGATATAMVGFEDEMIQIMDELTNQQTRRHIISIVGMGGTGKTTLAHNLYHNLLIMQHFDVRAWATVSQQYNVSHILSELLSSHGKSSGRSVNELGEKLYKTLYGRRYLIILDDIWSVQVWDELSRFFPDNENGSRIVLTTRLSNVANACGSFCLRKKLLSRNKSWKLFCEKAFGHKDGCPYELEKIGHEIVELCKGLPLSIVVIGGSLLKSPRTVGHWKNVAKGIKSIPISKEKQESLDVLLSSYHHLPPHLKPCFLYIGVFKNFEQQICVSEIIKLWVAEGFLKSEASGRVLEEIAEDYLLDLIDRNLILVGNRSDSGKIKSCEIHDLLRDLCLKLAERQEFIHVSKGLTRGTERRLIYTTCLMEGSAEPPLVRSIMTYKVGKHELDKCRLLRVLHVEDSASVNESFRHINLRYLVLDYPTASKFQCVWKIPTSVSMVWNLQTFTIEHDLFYLKLVVAPKEIWKMRQLRHIKCTRVYLPHPSLKGQDDLFIWENLQSLKNAINFMLSEEVCKIIPNVKKLHLHYARELRGYNARMMKCLCNLSRLHKLESLELIAASEWPTRNRELNKILTFPTSLKKLSLAYCRLHWYDLRMIGSLPLLEVLKLEFGSVTEGQRQWSPVDGQFVRLKLLKLYECGLVCWNAESCHFPVLQKLFLRHVQRLEEIPSGIGEILTLELIHLQWCSKSAAISAVKIKMEQLEYQGDDDLQIQVFDYHENLRSLREMVEKEGLTTNNIQLKSRGQ